MTRRVLGPFNRVEGDLEVNLDVKDGVVAAAWVNSPLYRGFEQILQGRDPMDALVIAPRICGICSVSQSVAAARALASLSGVEAPRNGELAVNLTLACENLADHLSHFYLFFMPDFARPAYRKRPWFEAAAKRFAAQGGAAAREAMPARTRLLNLMGYLAGKWPHSLSIRPGGSARAIEAGEQARLYTLLREFRGFLERVVFADRLERVLGLRDADDLAAWAQAHPDGDLGRFWAIAQDLDLARLGASPGRYMSYGAYPAEGAALFRAGVWDREWRPLDPALITEDLASAWLSGPRDPLPPMEGVTVPEADRGGGYTWCKAPRLDGRVVETGALARQVVDGQPLARDLDARHGSTVLTRVLGRLLELARVLPAMEDWVRALEPRDGFCHDAPLPADGEGIGLTEAARGSLGHWLRVRQGSVDNYQIVAPTTWNFSPRDQAGTPGALEQALVGTPAPAREDPPVAVQHVVRSFDPCMVCTVH